jgi:hypothetical protein
MKEYISKKVLTLIIGGIVLLTVVDYFVYSNEIEVGLLDIGSFILNNTILMGFVLLAYILLKFIITRGTSKK